MIMFVQPDSRIFPMKALITAAAFLLAATTAVAQQRVIITEQSSFPYQEGPGAPMERVYTVPKVVYDAPYFPQPQIVIHVHYYGYPPPNGNGYPPAPQQPPPAQPRQQFYQPQPGFTVQQPYQRPYYQQQPYYCPPGLQ
jgi:hypothetical protein